MFLNEQKKNGEIFRSRFTLYENKESEIIFENSLFLSHAKPCRFKSMCLFKVIRTFATNSVLYAHVLE